MKKFIKIDYEIQSFLFILFFIFLVLDLLVLKSIISVAVYFLIAVQHIISSNKRFFSKRYTKTIGFKIYYGISMLFMVSLLSLFLFSGLSIKSEYYIGFGYGVLSFGLLGTPVLAVAYYIICHYDYKKLK